jgi:hypothetical protein
MPTSIEGLKAAADIAKQIIALSTGSVAFTITFLDKFQVRGKDQFATIPLALYVSWVLFGATILFALFHLMGITGSLESIDRKTNGWSLTPDQTKAANGGTDHLRWPGMAMLAFFLFAVIAMIASGFAVR